MSLVKSIDVPLGWKMKRFTLQDAKDRAHDSDDFFGELGLLVVFTCNHCPYAAAQWPRLIELARYGREFGIATVAINPNIHPDYPGDAPERMLEKIRELGIDFPYLVDEGQLIARAFKAQCTPDPYLFDRKWRLVYHGRIDDCWEDPAKVTRQELKDAMDRLIAGNPPLEVQHPAMGCSIKWRSED